MKFKLLSLIGVSIILLGCGNGQQEKDSKREVFNERTSINDAKIEELEIEASRLRAGSSIKIVELADSTVTISYVSNFKEYREINPQSSLTESELKAYWESEDAIEKALIDGSVRIMRKLDFVNEVNIILPYDKKVYEISVKKSELEKFIGMDFRTITENWDKTFSDLFVYDRKGRQTFFKKFGVKK